jgi:hypothetical protein
VNHRQKLRIQQNVVPSNGKKSQCQVQYTVHRFFLGQHFYCGVDRNKREDEKEIFGEGHVFEL